MQIAIIYLLYEIITGVVVGGFLNPIAFWFGRGQAEAGKVMDLPGFVAAPAAVVSATPPTTITSNTATTGKPISGAVRGSLQIAILYSAGHEHDSLRLLLESHNVHIVAHQLIDSNWRTTLEKLSADLLLVNMGEDFGERQELLDVLMEESRMPVVVNDKLSSHSNLPELGVDWVRNLVHKFHLLAGKSPEPVKLEA
jgi:hypothetical protein